MIIINSKYTYIDVIIALNISDNFTAHGELFIDDPTKKSDNNFFYLITVLLVISKLFKDTERKDNYHRLINMNVYRRENDV
jgi:hypothetical protein